MRFDQFIGPSYTLASISMASERCMNWYPEYIEGQTEKNTFGLVRTPGLSLFTTLPKFPVRGMFPGDGRLFVVAGDSLFEVFTGGAYTNRSVPNFPGSSGVGLQGGPVGNDGKPVLMFANGNQLLVISAGQAYIDNGNGPVPCRFKDDITGQGNVSFTDLYVLATPFLMGSTGTTFGQNDVGKVFTISSGSGFIAGSYTALGLMLGATGQPNGLLVMSDVVAAPSSSGGSGVEVLGGPASFTDLYTLPLPYLMGSASHNFGQSDVGLTFVITGGPGFIPGDYLVQGLMLGPTGQPNGVVILDRPVAAPQSTGGIGTEGAQVLVTASYGAFLDGCFFVSPAPPTKEVFFSAINDGTSWDPLDFFSKEAYPDNVSALMADHEELFVFGDLESTELFRNYGDPDNPFQRDQNAIMHYACIAPYSVVRFDQGVAWIAGDDRRGDRVAFVSRGFTPVKISTAAVEIAWAAYSTVSDAVAYTYIDRGHQFWVINFPTGNATWAYDLSTGWWHERGWWNGASWDRQRQAFHAVVAFPGSGEKHYVGDWQSGKLYIQDWTYKDDAGTAIYRLRRAPHLTQENLRRFYNRFELDCDVLGLQRIYWNRQGYGRDRIWQLLSWQGPGTGVSLQLQWSDDRGQSYHIATTQTLNAAVDVQLANAYLLWQQGIS